jgi:glucokinase
MHSIKEQQYLPRFAHMNRVTGNQKAYVLAGDLGGTKTNLALFETVNGALNLLREQKYGSRDYTSFPEIVRDFIAKEPGKKPERICVGVAGPVTNGAVELTNLARELSEDEISQATHIDDTKLINDLEATAYGLATLEEADLNTLHKGDPENGGNMAIIAPGTGLGEAGLFWDGQLYTPFATEGGHCDFAPRNELDIALLQYLQEKYEIVSWERLVSGPGIYDIYQFLRDVRRMESPEWLNEELRTGSAAPVISGHAISGRALICVRAMELFVRYLAREAANLVFKMKATGGLFLGGGIPPKILPLLQNNAFYHHYLQGDRLVELLASVPVHVITNDKAALWGAAYFAANRGE